jgi:hypothetical protein
VVAEMLSVEVKTKGEDGNVTRDTHHVNLEQAYRTRSFAREILYFMSEEVRSGIREDFMKSKCRPKLVETNDPSVHLRPRPNPLFCLSFRVWRM